MFSGGVRGGGVFFCAHGRPGAAPGRPMADFLQSNTPGTLHCNGTYRFKTPTATEEETAEEKEEREAAAAVAVDYAWEMVAKKVRMTCGNGMDPRWIKTLAAKTGDKEWEDYLSTGDEMSDDSEQNSEDSE